MAITKRSMKRKSRRSSSKRSTRRRHHKSRKSMRRMRGCAHQGIINLPGAYFGKGTTGYYPDGALELAGNSNQMSVSQGTRWSSNCSLAGPNLYPMLGGGCGCGPKRRSKNNNKH